MDITSQMSLSDHIENTLATLVYIETEDCKKSMTEEGRLYVLRLTTARFRSLLQMKELERINSVSSDVIVVD